MVLCGCQYCSFFLTSKKLEVIGNPTFHQHCRVSGRWTLPHFCLLSYLITVANVYAMILLKELKPSWGKTHRNCSVYICWWLSIQHTDIWYSHFDALVLIDYNIPSSSAQFQYARPKQLSMHMHRKCYWNEKELDTFIGTSLAIGITGIHCRYYYVAIICWYY